MKLSRNVLAVLLVLSVIAPQTSFAEEPVSNTPVNTPFTSTAVNYPTLKSCFDYYRFGSVPVVMQSENGHIAQGGTLHLTGSIENQNNYPVDDVAVYAKVFYKKNFDKNSFGPDIIDMFTVVSHISLKAGEHKTLSYDWPVPANLQPGNYQVASYVASHDRFNLAGLTFSNDITGNLFNFAVVGQDVGSVRFDNTRTVFNGVGYHAAIFPPKTNVPVDGVPIVATVVNTSNQAFQGTVHWKLYSWDGINEANLIRESDSQLQVGAHATTSTQYVIKETNKTVYYVIGTLDSGKKGSPKSLLTVRYVSLTDTPQARLAFVGGVPYPAEKGATAVACFHSTGSVEAKDVKVEIAVTPRDPLQWLLTLGSLGKATYTGNVPGAVSAIVAPLTAASNNYSVKATLYQNGTVVDSVTSEYSCSMYGSCSYTSWIILLVVLIILLLLVAVLIRLKKKNVTVSPNTI